MLGSGARTHPCFPFCVVGRSVIEETLEARPLDSKVILPSPSDELFAEAAHSRGCASGNTLAPAKRGITLRAQFPHGGFFSNFWPRVSTEAALQH
jgi:hypothetical protein